MKQEIKENLYKNASEKYENTSERLEYDAEIKLRELADKGNEEVIKELSKRVF